jgi:hypothetical protein
LVAAAPPLGEPLPADVIAGLSGPGLRFLEQVWAEFSGWTPVNARLLHEAGRLIDELETLRGTKGERQGGGPYVTRHAAAR